MNETESIKLTIVMRNFAAPINILLHCNILKNIQIPTIWSQIIFLVN